MMIKFPKLGKKAKIFLAVLIIVWIYQAINIGGTFYKTSQNKYIVLRDSNTYDPATSKNNKLILKKRNKIKKNTVVYRRVHSEYAQLKKDYYYVDTNYIHKGSLQGYVKKENLKKIE